VAATLALLSSLAALAVLVVAKRPACFALAAPATAIAARFLVFSNPKVTTAKSYAAKAAAYAV